MLIRIANMDDVKQLRRIYLDLESDGTFCDRAIETMTFLIQYLIVMSRIFL